MRKVGSREFKNRMGTYLRAVRNGHTLIITDRGKAVAQVGPAEEKGSTAKLVEERWKELEALGFVHLAKKPLPRLRPVKSRRKPASQIIIEDRR